MRHRPWPIPDRPWAMQMRWCDLLFAHWTVDAAAVRRLIPPSLELDLFDGRAYVGAVPFRMEGVKPRWVPSLAWSGCISGTELADVCELQRQTRRVVFQS
jgi:uncharacterized protein YqjF (DUF2071 family)